MFTRCVFHEDTPPARGPLVDVHYPAATAKCVSDVVRGKRSFEPAMRSSLAVAYEDCFDTYPPPRQPAWTVDWGQKYTPRNPCPEPVKPTLDLPRSHAKGFAASDRNKRLVKRLRCRNVQRVYSLLDPSDHGYLDINEALSHIESTHRTDPELGELLLEALEGAAGLVSARGVIEKEAFIEYLTAEVNRGLGSTGRLARLRTNLVGHCNATLYAVDSRKQAKTEARLERCARGQRDMPYQGKHDAPSLTSQHTNPVARAFASKAKVTNELSKPLYRAVYKPGCPLGFQEHEATCALCDDDDCCCGEGAWQEHPFACLGGDFLRARLAAPRPRSHWGPVDASLEVHARITAERRAARLEEIRRDRELQFRKDHPFRNHPELHNCMCNCPVNVDRVRHLETCTALFHPCKEDKIVAQLAPAMVRQRMPRPNRVFPREKDSQHMLPVPLKQQKLETSTRVDSVYNRRKDQLREDQRATRRPRDVPLKDFDFANSFVIHAANDHSHWPASLRQVCDGNRIYVVPKEDTEELEIVA